MIDNYDDLDGLDLAERVRTRAVTPRELVDAAIRRVEIRNPELNAIVQPMFESARAAGSGTLPDGPFRGVPMLLKDLLSNVQGLATSSGSRSLQAIRMARDSELVKRYAATGVVFIGKTNTPEFGLTPYTESELWGPARNPWDLTRTPGGSSGGSAAAVAARIVPIAGGGDGGGSIRMPASCCGLFGMKPTRARTPTGPDVGEVWHGFVQEHVITRSVRDSAAMLDAVAGDDVGAPYSAPHKGHAFLDDVGRDPKPLRIAFSATPLLGSVVHNDCREGLSKTARLLESLGHHVEESTPPIDKPTFARAFLTLLVGEVASEIEFVSRLRGTKARRHEFEAATWALALLGRSMSASEYASAARTLQIASRLIGAFFSQYDVFVSPTLALPPVSIGELAPKGGQLSALKIIGALNAGWLLNALDVITPLADQTFAFMPYTPVFNVTGQPAMSVPLHWTESGLPIGMQFVGRFGDESTLFQLAGQLERAAPWANRKPMLRAV